MGVDEDGSDGWAITLGTAGWPLGEQSFSARAQDNDAAWSEPATATAVVENAVPLLAGLSATPSAVTRPGEITLAAGGVSDADGTVSRVEFYRGEVLLGVDEDGSDGWAITLGTAGWPLGEQSFSARAQDSDAAWSDPATATAVVADAGLGTVDFSSLEALDLSAGSLYYGFSTAHTGLLTVEAIAPSPPKSARIRLYAENPQEPPPPCRWPRPPWSAATNGSTGQSKPARATTWSSTAPIPSSTRGSPTWSTTKARR